MLPWQQDLLYGQPVPVHWAGWETDTRRLGRMGWRIATDYDMHRMAYHFIFRHDEMNLSAVVADWELRQPPYVMHDSIKMDLPPITINRVGFGRDPIIRVAGGPAAFQWKEIDTEHMELVSLQEYQHRVSEFGIFPLKDPAADVYVEEADHDVLDYLQKIVELQRPKQAELREQANKQMRDKQATPVKETARIIQLGAYR